MKSEANIQLKRHAQCKLGECYFKGQGGITERNVATALNLLQPIIAEEGDDQASKAAKSLRKEINEYVNRNATIIKQP